MIRITNLIIEYFYCFVAIGFFLCFSSCKCYNKPQTASNYRVITVDEKDFDRQKDFSRIFKSIDLIPLETKKESLIGRVSLIKEYKDHYYVLDKDISLSLTIFDKRGQFVKQICSRGRGPQEYIDLNFFSIDEYEDQLILCDHTLNKLLKYSLHGDFEEEVYLECVPIALEVLDESKYILRYDGPGDRIGTFTKDGKLIQSIFTYDINRRTVLFKDLIKCKDEVLFHQNYNDTIYRLSDRDVEPWLYIDFGERKVTDEMAENSFTQTMRLKRPIGVPVNTLTGSLFYTESDEKIFFVFTGYVDGHYPFHNLFYDKKSKKSIILPPGPGSEKKLYQKYKCLYGMFIQDVNSEGQFIGHFDPLRLYGSTTEFENLVKEGFVTINGTNSVDALKRLDENSNPCIAVYTFH